MMKEKKARGLENCICHRGMPEEECMLQGRETRLGRPSLLLHSCCGPCSTACIERMAPEYDITIFFYNPNITDDEEYERRKQNQIKFINAYNKQSGSEGRISFMEGEYDRDGFLSSCSAYADEPEGGKRCGICFDLRLEKTAQTAAMLNFDTFGTTLTVSPHKDYAVISEIGRRYADIYKVGFLDVDFKKKDGFKRSTELARKYDLYRQDFCGCEYSYKESLERKMRKEAEQNE